MMSVENEEVNYPQKSRPKSSTVSRPGPRQRKSVLFLDTETNTIVVDSANDKAEQQ